MSGEDPEHFPLGRPGPGRNPAGLDLNDRRGPGFMLAGVQAACRPRRYPDQLGSVPVGVPDKRWVRVRTIRHSLPGRLCLPYPGGLPGSTPYDKIAGCWRRSFVAKTLCF